MHIEGCILYVSGKAVVEAWVVKGIDIFNKLEIFWRSPKNNFLQCIQHCIPKNPGRRNTSVTYWTIDLEKKPSKQSDKMSADVQMYLLRCYHTRNKCLSSREI